VTEYYGWKMVQGKSILRREYTVEDLIATPFVRGKQYDSMVWGVGRTMERFFDSHLGTEVASAEPQDVSTLIHRLALLLMLSDQLGNTTNLHQAIPLEPSNNTSPRTRRRFSRRERSRQTYCCRCGCHRALCQRWKSSGRPSDDAVFGGGVPNDAIQTYRNLLSRVPESGT
jgi:hypothetical protein